jgi:hypothetical protein
MRMFHGLPASRFEPPGARAERLPDIRIIAGTRLTNNV